MRVAVIGAGVIGMSTAFAVKNAFPQWDITIFSEKFSPETTADGSAGLWGPYLLGNTSRVKFLKWAGDTHRWLASLWKANFAKEAGISLMPMYRLTKEPGGYPHPLWASTVYGAHELTREELKNLSKEHKLNYTGGWQFLSYTCEATRFLPWLTSKFIAMGGKIEKRKVETLHGLVDEGFDLIINCAGVGSGPLAADDKVIPVRGQVARVSAPWQFHVYIVDDDDGHYIIPNIDNVVLGGTHQENDYDTTVRKEDSDFIFRGCYQIVPALERAKVINEWVGLRPGRSEVRLEPEILKTPSGQEFTVIHNYGHGGSGVTLSWGCGLEVVEVIKKLKMSNTKSKL